MPGRVDTVETGPNPTITFDADTATVTAGGNDHAGNFVLRNADGNEVLRLRVPDTGDNAASIQIKRPDNTLVLEIADGLRLFTDDEELATNIIQGTLTTGGVGTNGRIQLRDQAGQVRIRINAEQQSMFFQNENTGAPALELGKAIKLMNETFMTTAVIDEGRLDLGNGGVNGTLNLLDESGKVGITAGGTAHSILVKGEDEFLLLDKASIVMSKSTGAVFILKNNGEILAGGGGGENGALILRSMGNQELGRIDENGIRLRTANDQDLFTVAVDDPALTLNSRIGLRIFEISQDCDVRVGGSKDGDLFLLNVGGDEAIHLSAEERRIVINSSPGRSSFAVNGDGKMILGGSAHDGGFRLVNGADQVVASLDSSGQLHLGSNATAGGIKLYRHDLNQLAPGNDDWTVHLGGAEGDIFLRNADCAEDFDVIDAEEAEPGTVLVIEADGALRQSRCAYDKKVAGVVSGAGEYAPGIVLDKKKTAVPRRPVALVGKVFCKVDAGYGPVEVGDLLTTSDTSGHAMKAHDPQRAFGACIGKALRPLPTGRALIPILIALQ